MKLLRKGAFPAILLSAVLWPGGSQPLHAQAPSLSGIAGASLNVTENNVALTLPVTPFLAAAGAVRVEVELVNPEDLIRALGSSTQTLRPKQKYLVVNLPKPFANVPLTEMEELHWLRLKYRILAKDDVVIASGIEPLLAPATEPFVLTAAARRVASEGRTFQVPVHAKASDGKPLRGIRVRGHLTWDADEGEQKLSASAFTNSSGNASLQFLIPIQVHAESGTLEVQAIHGAVTRSVDHDVYFRAANYLLLDTDKDIYQPGQTLHARILRFDARRKAVEKESLEVRITDPEGSLISKQMVLTDAFGVARMDWDVPANIRQGNYSVQIESGGDEDDDRRGNISKSVHIYRYDLPNFRVAAKPDRSYYLPKQNADIVVSAEYLFGKPITRGKVRVVQEEEREWNYRKQKWEVKESHALRGELDHEGRFTAHFDLAEAHDSLHDESEYQKFEDLDLAAYVTDLTTGRTEQRRFTLRVTREPIHVYLMGAGASAKRLPPSYYISTFYADGTPAHCKVQLSSRDRDDDSAPRHPLRTVNTNKYGLARVTELKIPEDDDDDSIVAEARDQNDQAGTGIDNIYQGDLGVLEVTSSKAIEKHGDPIEVNLRSTSSDLPVVVEAVREGAVLATQQVRLRNGRAYIVFPYDPRFTDEITIIAYSLERETGSENYFEGAATVLYPKNRQLQVGVQLDRDEHRPGEDASVKFEVHQPDSSAAESVLGVKLVDSAVEERARTDSDFGQRSGSGWWRWSLWSSNNEAGFSGVSREDLDRIDLDQPIPEDLDLVAGYILNSGGHETPELLHDAPQRTVDEAFSKIVSKQFTEVEQALRESS